MEEVQKELEEVQDEAVLTGRRLGLLLAAAELPDEQKAAWASLIPDMTAEQMQDLAEALALRIPDSGERAFADLAAKLKELGASHEARVADATEVANRALDDIESDLSPV